MTPEETALFSDELVEVLRNSAPGRYLEVWMNAKGAYVWKSDPRLDTNVFYPPDEQGGTGIVTPSVAGPRFVDACNEHWGINIIGSWHRGFIAHLKNGKRARRRRAGRKV